MVYNEQLVAERIAELRRQKCLSQEDLAEMAAREWSTADYAGKGSEDGEHLRLHRRRLGA